MIQATCISFLSLSKLGFSRLFVLTQLFQTEVNSLHPSLNFTVERETNGTIPFLDMKITHMENRLESSWYTKDTDTGFLMNFHALAPLKILSTDDT